MRNVRKPAAGLGCLLALAAAGCSGHGDTSAAAPTTAVPGTSYAPYVSAAAPAPTDSAGAATTYNLAFVTADGGACTPRWDGSRAVDDAAVRARIAALEEDGGRVRVSFGGASGTELGAACGSVRDLAAAYGAALDAAGTSLADFDIEGDELTDSASVDLRSRAIARLQEERPGLEVSFTLPVMPSGLDEHALALLGSADDHGVRVRTVNLMAMNYAPAYDGDMGGYALTAARAAHAQLRKVFGTSQAAWRGMALTSMIGVNDVPGETFTLADAAEVRAFAEARGLAWVSMWGAAPAPGGAPRPPPRGPGGPSHGGGQVTGAGGRGVAGGIT
ncbi:hydrolase, partial [Streptomyces sp. NPDC059720]|uniref:hydrolase n=1 Tax=Streptomyces sp. NPDC059720 TaxID=3346924 RepID=UPI00368C8446